MNAIETTTIPSRATSLPLASRRTHGVASVARITTGIIWLVLMIATWVVVLDASFGYSGTGPAVQPPFAAPLEEVPTPQLMDESSATTPQPGPAPAVTHD